jgi:hypothetical protein
LPKLASNNLRKWFLSPTGRLNFGFITKGKFTIVLITPYSWGSRLVYAPGANPIESAGHAPDGKKRKEKDFKLFVQVTMKGDKQRSFYF